MQYWTLQRQLLWSLLAITCCVLWGQLLLSRFRPQPTHVIDFYQEWSSARNLLTGRPIYTPIEDTFQPYLGLTTDGELNWDINVHPPTSVLLAVPFAGLNYYDATLAWNLVSCLALVTAIWIVGHQLEIRFTFWSIFPLITVMMFASPIWQQITQGQLNSLLTLLIVGIWAAARNQRSVWAGVLLGLAAAIKLFPGFLIVYFLLRREWRTVVAAAASFLTVTGITLVVLGLETYQTYLTVVLPSAVDWKSTWNNASWPGLAAKLFNPAGGHTSTHALWESQTLEKLMVLIGWLLVLGGLALLTKRADSQRSWDHTFGATVMAMLILSPVTWEHYFLLLLVPLAVLWKDPSGTAASRVTFYIAFAVLCLPIYALCNSLIEGGFAAGTAGVTTTLTLLSLQCYSLCWLFGQQFIRGWTPTSPDKSLGAASG